MNDTLSVEAIAQTRDVFAHFQFSPNDTQLLFRQHGPLLFQAILQCLDLRDLVNRDLNNRLTTEQVELVSGMNISYVNDNLNWCDWAQTAWFPRAFHAAYDQSWQKRTANLFSTYIFPITSSLNLLSLFLTLFGISAVVRSSYSRGSPDLCHRNYDLVHIPATWPIMITYCWISIIFVLVMDLRSFLFSHLPASFNPINYNFGCRMFAYLRNVLKYTPTWLLSVMVADRAFGELRHSRRQLSRLTETPLLAVDESNRVPVSSPNTDETFMTTPGAVPGFPNSNEHVAKPKPRTWCTCTPLKHFLCIYRSPIWCAGFDAISPLNFVPREKQQAKMTESLTRHRKRRPESVIVQSTRSEWCEIAAGRVGGCLLVGTTVSGLCLVNTHSIWLYDVDSTWKTCMLTAGNSVILGEVYPYFTQVVQSFVPHAVQLCSLLLLFVVFRRINSTRSRAYGVTSEHPTSSNYRSSKPAFRRGFVQPTQVAIVLSVVGLVCEMPDHFLWLQSKLHDNVFPSLGSYSGTSHGNANSGPNHSGTHNSSASNCLSDTDTSRAVGGGVVTSAGVTVGVGNGVSAVRATELDTCRILQITNDLVINLRDSCLLEMKMIDMKSTILISAILQAWVQLRWISTFPVLWLTSPHFRATWLQWFARFFEHIRLSNHIHVRWTKSKSSQTHSEVNEASGAGYDRNSDHASVAESHVLNRQCSVALCCCICATDFHELTFATSPVDE